MAAPAGIASWITYRMHVDLQQELGQLSPASKSAVDASTIVGRVLSIEGRWSDAGCFLATDLEELPASRRPKLRGTIQSVQRENGTIAVLGRAIRIDSETEFDPALRGADPLSMLSAGQRVEVSCSVDRSGAWSARRIATRTPKPSDKIKGRITRAQRAADALRLEIDGLPIDVPPTLLIASRRGPIHRMELSSQMALAIQECLTAAHELLRCTHLLNEAHAKGTAARAAELAHLREDVQARLRDSGEELLQFVALNRASVEQEVHALGLAGALELSAEVHEEVADWLRQIEEKCAPLPALLAGFARLALTQPDAAEVALAGELEPKLRAELLPLVHAYQLEIEEELADEIEVLAQQAESVVRVAIGASVGGLALALVLGALVARSITRRVFALRSAAARVGSGDLAARVDIGTGDELGALAETFNRMAERLATTTVSVHNLNEVIDSVAGGLFLLEPDGRIASVNPAASTLLGYAPQELVGTPFGRVCAELGAPLTHAGLVGGEQSFRTRDGLEIPVSFSLAPLGGAHDGGPARAYVCLAQDVSVRKKMEEDLRRSLAEKELLLREVHHRVKNNLQVVSSLLDLQSRSISDPRALEKFQNSQDRIRSIVLIHEQLYGSRELESIHVRTYLELLITNLSRSHVDRADRIRVRATVDDFRLSLDQALSCGLIVNELVTNALKHAFSPDSPGEIRVVCRREGRSEDAGTIVLAVSDDGCGFEDGPAELGASLGLGLVEALVKQLRGRLRHDGVPGASFTVEFPEARLAAVG
ncbi:MAG: histidine kinase dimerization/phosphoacceptor domain -containing protein [Planctomycetota bacterium]